jgi:hypothetical protein
MMMAQQLKLLPFRPIKPLPKGSSPVDHMFDWQVQQMAGVSSHHEHLVQQLQLAGAIILSGFRDLTIISNSTSLPHLQHWIGCATLR